MQQYKHWAVGEEYNLQISRDNATGNGHDEPSRSIIERPLSLQFAPISERNWHS
jgi:hypothetical protein